MLLYACLSQVLLYGCLLQPPAESQGWVSLFNGKNYAGFKFWIAYGPEKTFFVEDGCLAFRGQVTGFTYTTQHYRNYELSYDWRYLRPQDLKDDASFAGNSGVFLHLSRIIPKDWPRSLEVEGKYVDMGKLIPHDKVQGEFKDYPEARKAAMKPVGEWNTTLVKCKEGSVSVTINGKLIAEGQLAAEDKNNQWEGPIAFQAQGADINYRNIRIREMK